MAIWGKLVTASLGSVLAMLFACGGGTSQAPSSSGQPLQLRLTTVVTGLSDPLDVQQPNDATSRLLIVEQAGVIRIFANGALLTAPFLDIRSKVRSGGEMGLLGLAFHPNFRQNRRLFLNYTRISGTQLQSVIAEYLVAAADPNRAEAASERILLTLDQPFQNHNGGQLAFGPDGFLYIGFGDGGSGGDPLGNGQNLQTLLGKILRINVDAGSPYGIPADNPFAAGGGRPEIWAYGLRNPWRFSFDRNTGRLFCADVGQSRFEEVDLIQRGGNYGWNTMEGAHCFSPMTACNTAGLMMPIAEYDRSEGISVTGGFVYRGTAIPELQGAYVFGDFGTGNIWQLREGSPGQWARSLLLASGRSISSFGQDQSGELYVVDYGGSVLRLARQ